MTETRWRVLLALIVAFSIGRIAMTHRVFSQTADERWHVIAGYDVLRHYDFRTDSHHPPLARVLFALPFVNEPEPSWQGEMSRGTVLLVRDGRYAHNLARARSPNLVFVAIAIVTVAVWARRLFSPAAGLFAALFFSLLPPVLAHGGLATTDMALTATLLLALYVFALVLEEATWPRTIGLGVAVAAGLLAKYSFPVFFPVCALVLVAVHRRFPLAKLVSAMLIAFAITFMAMPPREFLEGIASVAAQAVSPPKPIIFGEVRDTRCWYYFPVALFFKTPIPFLVLAVAGLRRRLDVALVAAAILGIAMTSNINLGIRHILPIYGLLAIAAAAAVRARWVHAILIAWLVVGSVLAHPDYLAWFNAFAGKEPHRILNDSNLDWGQDALRLAEVTRREKIAFVTTSLACCPPLDHIGLPPHAELKPLQPVRGWLAIGELNYTLLRASPETRRWLDQLLAGRPYRRVGKTIRLYSIE